MAAEKKKLWGGRFSEDIDPLMEKFNESLSFDRRMAQEDMPERWRRLGSSPKTNGIN